MDLVLQFARLFEIVCLLFLKGLHFVLELILCVGLCIAEWCFKNTGQTAAMQQHGAQKVNGSPVSPAPKNPTKISLPTTFFSNTKLFSEGVWGRTEAVGRADRHHKGRGGGSAPFTRKPSPPLPCANQFLKALGGRLCEPRQSSGGPKPHHLPASGTCLTGREHVLVVVQGRNPLSGCAPVDPSPPLTIRPPMLLLEDGGCT